jgi:hypothetical protein
VKEGAYQKSEGTFTYPFFYEEFIFDVCLQFEYILGFKCSYPVLYCYYFLTQPNPLKPLGTYAYLHPDYFSRKEFFKHHLYFTLLYFTQPYSLKGNRQHITTTLFFSV